MRRLFWLSVGAGAGVYATRRVNRFTRQWAPENIAARTGERLLLFARDVREQTRARETQLREALELDETGTTGTIGTLKAVDGRSPGTGRPDPGRRALDRPTPRGVALPPAAVPRRAIAAGAAQLRRALPQARPPQRPALREAAEGQAPRRVLEGQYTIINDDNDDKDGY